MRCEDGCTRLNGPFSHKIGEKTEWEALQWIQALVPLRHPPLNPNVRCLRHRGLRAGHSDEKVPLSEGMFLDIWDIDSPED